MGLPSKEMQMPERPFVYIAGRLYLPLQPVKPRYPESLTEEKGDAIARKVGQTLDVTFESSPRVFVSDTLKYQPFASTRARLEDFGKTPVESPLAGLKIQAIDWVYRFRFVAEDSEFVRKLAERRDPRYDSEWAFRDGLAHWRSENWSCLTVEVPYVEGRPFRTDVDVFAPRADARPSEEFVMGLHSHRPDILKQVRGEAEPLVKLLDPPQARRFK